MAGIGIGISPLVYNGQQQRALRAWRAYTDTTLAVTPLSSTTMGLLWTNPVIQGATLSNVLVYRGIDGVNFSLVDTLGVVTSYEDTTCSNGTLYYYYLVFVNSRSVRTAIGTAVSARTINYVDYIQSSGTQYINTGVIDLTSDVKLEGTLDVVSQKMIFGKRIDNTNQFNIGVAVTNNLYVRYNGAVNIAYYGTLYKVEVKENDVYINDILKTSSITGYDTNLVDYVFGLNINGIFGASAIGKLYYITRGNSYRYKPALNLSGQFCMFDEVSKTYKLNAGTGIFTGGGVTSPEIDALLIQYAAAGVASVTIDFRGTDNGTRSTASDAAVTTLTAAGCTILTNP